MFRRFGRSGLGISPISLGTMGFGPSTRLETAERLVRQALDLGINVIDTANCYDGPHRTELVQGHAQQMLGKILRGGRREDVVLISKIGVPLRPGPQHRGLSSTHLLRELDVCLQQLRTDYLDVLMLHWPDKFANTEEVLRTMDAAVRSGKIRHFGLSNHCGWQVCEYLWMGDRRGWPMASASQIPFSLLDRRFENDLPFYAQHEVAVLAYQPLCGGLLTDRQREPEAETTQHAEAGIQSWGNRPDEDQRAKIRQLGPIADELGLSLAQLALGWVLAQPQITSVVLGARTERQLKTAVDVATWCPPADVLASLDQICPGPPKPTARFER